MKTALYVTRFVPLWASFLSSLFLTLRAQSSPAQEQTQTHTLRPGWNAVWIEVEPTNPDPGAVFANLPLASAWTWSERVSATDFIQNPEATGWNRARWLVYFPTDSPEARVSNLYAILPRRAYLLKITGTNSVVWNVTGKPSVINPSWSPDRYNLRGFPVDPTQPPTFVEFFRWSPAHYHEDQGQLESIHQLNADGTWQQVNPSDRMLRGEAYWVYTRGASDYAGPFSLEITTGSGLEFGTWVGQNDVLIHNGSVDTKTLKFAAVSGNPTGLFVLRHDFLTNSLDSLDGHQETVPPNQTRKITVQLKRDTGGGTNGSVLSVNDGSGTMYYVSQNGRVQLLGEASLPTGLWAGTVTITNVSTVTGTNGLATNTGPVALGFPMRVLVHVDTNGLASLLREVTILYPHSAFPVTNINQAGPGQLASLITDPAVLAQVSANDLRSGNITARRLSAPHFDFLPPPGQFELPLVGEFAVSNQVTATLNIPSDLPTNPFLHRYHPDHGTNHAYAVTREITFNILPGVNNGITSSETLGGSFSETINGLHKLPLFASGQLELQRVSTTGVLNILPQ